MSFCFQFEYQITYSNKPTLHSLSKIQTVTRESGFKNFSQFYTSIKLIHETQKPVGNLNSVQANSSFTKKEVLAGIGNFLYSDREEWIVVLVLLFMFFASILIHFYKQWKIQRSDQYKQLARVEKEKQILIEHYSTLTENANDAIILANEDRRIIDVNKRAGEMYGYTKDEFLKLYFIDIIKDKNCFYDERLVEIKEKKGLVYECVHLTKSGSDIPVEISAKFIEAKGENYLQNIIRDVTETKEAYKHLERESRLFAVLSQINQCIIQSKTQDELFSRVCKIFIETGKFKFCWIGFVDESKQEIIPQASHGEDLEYLKRVNLKLFEVDSVIRPFKKTILSDSTIVVKNIYEEEHLPWFDEAVKRNFISLVSVPIRKFEIATGCFNIYADEKNFFKRKRIKINTRNCPGYFICS